MPHTTRVFSGVLVLAIAAAFHGVTARADSLASIIASNATIRAGGLVFSGFRTSSLTDAAAVEVTPFSTGGESGLRMTPIPAGGRFAATAGGGGGGGARELVFDVIFTVTAAAPMNSARQATDPTSAATGNAVLRNLTTFITGPTDRSLFSCIAGADLPPGQICSSPLDSTALPAGTTTFVIDRQLDISVGQKGGLSGTGDASTGYFDVSFSDLSRKPSRRRIVSH